MKPTAIITNRRGALRGVLSLALLTGLALSPAALAKPGGNGGGKGGGKGGGNGGGGDDGGGDPPAVEAPVKYQLSWVDLGGSTTIKAINSQGVGVGYWKAEGAPDRSAIVRFPDGDWHDLNVVLADHLPGDGWYFRVAWAMTDDFVVAGGLRDPEGGANPFVAKLEDQGPGILPKVLWFRRLSGADLGAPAHTAPHRPVIWDAGENGEFVLQVPGSDWDDGIERTFVWSPGPETDFLRDPPIEAGPIVESISYHGVRMNAHSQVLLPPEARIVDTITGDDGPWPAGGYANDIGDDGTLLGIMEERARVKGYGWTTIAAAARCVNGVWEPISEFYPRGGASRWSIAAFYSNAAGQIVGYRNGPCFLYADDGQTDLRLLDDLLDFEGDPDGAAFWESLPAGLEWDVASIKDISEPDASGFGWICGNYVLDGRVVSFVLRPIAVP